jgi:hypothetical protein
MGALCARNVLVGALATGCWFACGLPLNGTGHPGGPSGPDSSALDGPGSGFADSGSPSDTSTDAPPDVDAGPFARWTKRIELTIHNEGHPAFNDFPILVVLTPARVPYANLQAKGQDLRFTDSDGATLPHEIEAFTSGGTSFVWVKVNAPDAAPLHLWMYYGNAGAPDAQDPAGLWKQTYVGVWHLADEHDSTGNHASVTHGFGNATGLLGDPAASFDGVAQYIDTASTDQLSAWTIEEFVTSPSSPQSTGHSYPIARGNNYQVLWNSDPPYPAYAGSVTASFGGVFPLASFGALSGATWTYLATTYDGMTLRAFVDGRPANTTAWTGKPDGESASATIAALSQGQGLFEGTISEVRLVAGPHSSDWLAAQNQSLRDQGYVTYGPEQSNP